MAEVQHVEKTLDSEKTVTITPKVIQAIKVGRELLKAEAKRESNLDKWDSCRVLSRFLAKVGER